MESLCHSANKGSDDAYDVSTSLTLVPLQQQVSLVLRTPSQPVSHQVRTDFVSFGNKVPQAKFHPHLVTNVSLVNHTINPWCSTSRDSLAADFSTPGSNTHHCDVRAVFRLVALAVRGLARTETRDDSQTSAAHHGSCSCRPQWHQTLDLRETCQVFHVLRVCRHVGAS